MMPSASELKYFVEVSGSLNFTRAAERLGISQPSLSVAMQRLEHTIGMPLFFRSKRGVVLTQAGKQLLHQSRRLLADWELIKSQAMASEQEVQGAFTIGCHVSVGLYSLPGVVDHLLEKFPKLELKFAHDLSRRIAERVIRSEVDIGIVVNPVRHPDLIIRKLAEDEVTFWRGAGDRRIQNLSGGEGVLICDPDLIQTQDLLKKLKRQKIVFSRTIESSSLEVVTQLAASGAGVCVLPGRVASTALGQGLRKIPKTPIFRDEICLIYRVENKGVRSIQVIAEKFIESFKGGVKC